MNLYTGDFWVPFPRSEYGGMWVVIAKDVQECIDLLKNDYHTQYFDEDGADLDDLINSVKKAHCFKLDAEVTESRIVEVFFT